MPNDDIPITPDPDAQTETLDEEPRSILLGLISQLRKGMDLHRVTLPTFVLEPRSMLERMTDFMSHPDLVLTVPSESNPEKRFLAVLKYFLSGWHIRPKGVKKPFNPVLGEFFRCRWNLDDGKEAFFVAEQVSHHPPISAFFYAIPEANIFVNGEMRPKSKFLGNSAASIMEGGTTIRTLNFPNESYFITFPNVYAKGLLFGTMLMELGDTATVKCEAIDLTCDLEFTTKGFFSGSYNGLKGKVKRISNGETLYQISGKWTDVIYISTNDKKAQPEVFFDANTAQIHPKIVHPESEQEEYESRRLWNKLTAALLARNIDLATEEKTKVEDHQRKIRGEREKNNETYKSRYFQLQGSDWIFSEQAALMKLESKAAKTRINEIIWPKK